MFREADERRENRGRLQSNISPLHQIMNNYAKYFTPNIHRFKEVPSCILCSLLGEATRRIWVSKRQFESFTRERNRVLIDQDAEEQGKRRKKQEEGKERKRGAEERARFQGGWSGICPGACEIHMCRQTICLARSFLYLVCLMFLDCCRNTGDQDVGQRTPRGHVFRRGETPVPYQGQAQEEGKIRKLYETGNSCMWHLNDRCG